MPLGSTYLFSPCLPSGRKLDICELCNIPRVVSLIPFTFTHHMISLYVLEFPTGEKRKIVGQEKYKSKEGGIFFKVPYHDPRGHCPCCSLLL